ncbi:MAG: CSLREA domain-containing protein [Anaerolineales bacterium]|nr:CSLREA domain-containing protein [Anaerolineales bacterium]
MKTQWLYKVSAALMIVMLAVTALPVTPAYAATFTVTKTTDTNDGVCNADCSLREAIAAANAAAGADIITLTSGSTYALTLTAGGTGDLDVTSSIVIQASGATVAIIDPVTTAPTNYNDRVFDVSGAGNLTLDTIRITTANTANDGAAIRSAGTLTIQDNTEIISNTSTGDGGAIFQSGGTLTINGTTFTSNTSPGGDGGAIFQDGGTLSIGATAAVTFSGNTTGGAGGAIHVAGGTLTVNNTSFTNSTAANSADEGGAIFYDNNTLLTVTNSTFTGNRSTNGDGGAIMINDNGANLNISGSTFTSNTAQDDGGAIFHDGNLFTVTTSTFASNSAGTGAGGTADGGAIRITNNSNNAASKITLSTFTNNSITMAADRILHGGAIANDGRVIIANDTFSANSLTKSTAGVGDSLGGAIYAAGTTTVHNVTMSGNTVSESGTGTGSGGSIYSLAGAMTIANSIVANGTENGVASNCGGTITVGVSNVDFNGNADCGFAITTNPNLGALTGSPQYFPLTTGSSAIDTGSNAICATATTTNNQSQNGLTRPMDGNGDSTATCDIGSYEAPALTPTVTTITTDSPDASLVGGSVLVTVTVTGGVTPTGTANITGADTNCSITLSGGTGSCNVIFTSVGSKTLTATYVPDTAHTASSDTEPHTVNQATSTVIVSCPGTPQLYTGSAQTPCTASFTTSDGLSGSLTPTYSNNMDAGLATANATYVGDANHATSSNSANFTISQAASTVTVTCPVSVLFTGSAQTPCTAEATGVGMSPVDVTASLIYSNNTNAGAATANASWAGDINHTGNNGSGGFTIGQATSTVTVTCPVSAPFTGLSSDTLYGRSNWSGHEPSGCDRILDLLEQHERWRSHGERKLGW